MMVFLITVFSYIIKKGKERLVNVSSTYTICFLIIALAINLWLR
jgi:hypothetical protein